MSKRGSKVGSQAATAGGPRKRAKESTSSSNEGPTPGKKKTSALQAAAVVTPAPPDTAGTIEKKKTEQPMIDLAYLRKDIPLPELTDKLLVDKVRLCVDNKFYPFDKYYSRSKYMSGVVQVAFLDMGWGRDTWEYAHKRATGMNAVIDVMADRVSDNREKSKLRCKKKFERKYKRCGHMCQRWRWY